MCVGLEKLDIYLTVEIKIVAVLKVSLVSRKLFQKFENIAA